MKELRIERHKAQRRDCSLPVVEQEIGTQWDKKRRQTREHNEVDLILKFRS